MSDDTEVQFSLDEFNTIVEQDKSPKHSIHVLWTAPSAESCLVFKWVLPKPYPLHLHLHTVPLLAHISGRKYTTNSGRRSVSKSWKDDCALSTNKSLPKRIAIVALATKPPTRLGTYVSLPKFYTFWFSHVYASRLLTQVTFEGLWSKETHPKNFPKTLQLTHFSDIVGCSHSKNLTMWAEGWYASEGMRQLAEFGSGTIIQSELLEKVRRVLFQQLREIRVL